MGTIMYNGTLYSGGGGKGLQYWTEDKDSIYNESDISGASPEAQIELVDSGATIGTETKMYQVFTNTDLGGVEKTFNPNNSESTNFAKVDISSWCYPCLNNNFNQPETYDFGWCNTSENSNMGVKDVGLPSQKYINMHTAGASLPMIEHVLGYDENYETEDKIFHTKMFEPFSSRISRSYVGFVNLNVYNNSTYGDIAGINGYNKDYGFLYTWSDIKIFLCKERVKISNYVNDWTYPDRTQTYDLSKKIRDDVGDDKIKETRQVINTVHTVSPLDSSAHIIELPDLSTYVNIRIVGNASMGDGTFESFDETYKVKNIPYSNIKVHGTLWMSKGQNDTSLEFISTDDSNRTSTITAIYADIRDDTCQAIYDHCYLYDYYYPTNTIDDLANEVYSIMLNSEYNISEKEAMMATYGKYNDINYPYNYQSSSATTYNLVRDHTSEYLNINQTLPFIFKVMCLGKLYRHKVDVPYTENDYNNNLTKVDFEDISKAISGEVYGSFRALTYHNFIRDYFTIRDHDLNDSGDDKVDLYSYKDRTLARHGIIMDDNDVAWYVFLTPAKLIGSDDYILDRTGIGETDPIEYKQLSYLNFEETPNHWAYYNGANPVDETKSYTTTHKNGITFQLNFASLSNESEEKYHNNFINLAKQIVSKLKVSGIKPYFDAYKMKTGIYIDSSNGTAFSSGNITNDTGDYIENVNINGSIGNIKTKGSITSQDNINGKSLSENNVLLEDKYQQKLTAGENITIEDNVISASGGGGDATHSYTTEAKIVGTWTDGRNIYEQSYYIAKQSSQLPAEWYQSVYIDTNLELPDGHTIDNVDIISVDGSIRDNRFAAPIQYYASNSIYVATSFYPSLNNNKVRIRFSMSKGSGVFLYGYNFTIRYVI